MQKTEKARIGVFGGSGFYQFGENVEEIQLESPYGKPSSAIFLATIEGKRVAFLPRHGIKHELPPHKINYRANVWAMKEIGVEFLLCPCAVGSLQLNIKPGEFVFCNQFIDQTCGRLDTFYEGPEVIHISCADLYCPELRKIGFQAAEALKIAHHKTGTMVVINGPRFASRAESKDFSTRGFHIIGMTQYPESVLAHELEMHCLNIALVTDFDSGLEQETGKTESAKIMQVFKQNLENVKKLLFGIIKEIPESLPCKCDKALDGAKM